MLPPIRIPGGGVTSAPIDGVVHVYVVEPGTATPIAGAAVHLGGAGGALQLNTTTDPAGLAVFRDAGIAGARTTTATASGRTAATWIGVAGGNVTIPLAPRVTPSAHVSDTNQEIQRWHNDGSSQAQTISRQGAHPSRSRRRLPAHGSSASGDRNRPAAEQRPRRSGYVLRNWPMSYISAVDGRMGTIARIGWRPNG